MLSSIIYDDCEPLPALAEFHALVDLMLDSDDENIKTTLEEALMLTKMIHGDEIKERMSHLVKVRQIKANDERMKKEHRRTLVVMHSSLLISLVARIQSCIYSGRLQKMIIGLKAVSSPIGVEDKLFRQLTETIDDFGDQLAEIE